MRGPFDLRPLTVGGACAGRSNDVPSPQVSRFAENGKGSLGGAWTLEATGRRSSRIDIEDVVADAEVADEVNDASLTKGDERGPSTKGPCEHGPSSSRILRCAALVARGKQSARCGGSQSASTAVSALSARSAAGHQSASTAVSALRARMRRVSNLRARSPALYLQGVRWVCNLRARSSALSVQGVWVCNLRARSYRFGYGDAVGAQSASTAVGLSVQDCGGAHLRARSCTLSMQGVRRVCDLRARSYPL